MRSFDFDAVKFDRNYLEKVVTDNNCKIVITELIRTARALGSETIAEGVENKAQCDILKEIGCGKIQGFYYSKPLSLEDILKRYETNSAIGFENRNDAEYYDALDKVNLYDMSSYIEEDINLKGYFDCLPMVVLLGYIDNQAELQHLEELERIKHERKAYARLAALTGDYICMYSINPETNAFTEYDSAEKYSSLHMVKQGNDFFKQPFKDGAELIYAGDREMFKSLFCKAEVMKQIAQKGIYILEYRAMIEDRPHYVRLKVAMVSEDGEMYKNKKQLKNKK